MSGARERCDSFWDIAEGDSSGYGLHCTRPLSHDGRHEAPAFKSVISWSDDEAVQPENTQ